ncbi:MAG TPA: hypothetical protein VGC44_01770 [Longimicrobiales bacterium]
MADNNDKGNFERVGESIGSVTGKAADTAVDLMSSMVKTAASTIGGWWSRSTPDEVRQTFTPEADSTCRHHFEQRRREGRTKSDYDALRPLYQFGHMAGANPDYQGRSFEEVENDLKRTWSPEYTTAFGEWNIVRDYINTGYATRNSRGGNLP